MEKNTVKAIRVALPLNLRSSGKKFPGIKEQEIGRGQTIGKDAKKKLGNQGWMTLEDYEAKNFGPYGLKEYFENMGKAEMVGAVLKENDQLQTAVLDKDKEIAELKAKLEALANTQPVSNVENVEPNTEEVK